MVPATCKDRQAGPPQLHDLHQMSKPACSAGALTAAPWPKGAGRAGSSSGEPPTGGSSRRCQPIPATSGAWRSPPTAPGLPPAASANDGSRSRDVATRKLVGRLPHPNFVTSAAFDPASRTLATWATDFKIRLWDLASQHQIGRPLPGNENGSGTNVSAFDPSGNHLIAVYDSGAAFVWDMDLDHWKQHACTAVGRSLTRKEWTERRGTDERIRRSTPVWWAWLDLNQRPHPYQRWTAKRRANEHSPRRYGSVSAIGMG